MFDDLVGQESAVAELRATATAAVEVLGGADGRGMTHAWLFTGPPGSGRSTAARAFAAALQCEWSGCGECDSCHTVLTGTHADVQVVRPEGLSFSVAEARQLVHRAAMSPSGRRWQIVLFEDADRMTEQAANALLKAIEEPPRRTVWLLCTPAPDDLVVTIRSRCRLVTLRTPPTEAVAEVLTRRDGVEPEMAAFAARAAQGHVGRARRLATDERSRSRRSAVLGVPLRVQGIGSSFAAAAGLVDDAQVDASTTSGELDAPETAALRRALGEGTEGRAMPRGTKGALNDLERHQKSRATRVKRDSLDRALLDLASFYRDVLILQVGARVELCNEEIHDDLRTVAESSTQAATLRRLEAIVLCRERIDLNVNPLLAVEALTLSLRAA
ncbi:MAG: DNA polymerase III subunit delta' [Streptosporangiales bacterium]|nr:DNA polymerase III subunit delta' [Streptosporangiales bacterium]